MESYIFRFMIYPSLHENKIFINTVYHENKIFKTHKLHENKAFWL